MPEINSEKERIKHNVKQFLMSRYLVCSFDQYRLNHDDHRRLDEILDGRELQDDENPIAMTERKE